MRTLNIFVLIQFTDEFHLIYDNLIRKPLEAKGHSVKRSLEAREQNGLRAIIQGIDNADVVIADLTGQNPNVTYELGIAHAFLKPTLQIAQTLDDVRYDLRPYRVILYNIVSDGSSSLADDILSYIATEPGDEYSFSNPVSDYMGTAATGPIAIPLADVVDDEAQLPLLAEETDSVSDVGDYGILDASADIDEASETIFLTLEGLTADIESIANKADAHTARLEKVQQSPNQRRVQRSAIRILGVYAEDVDEFAQSTDEKASILRDAWLATERSMERILFSSEIEDDHELASMENLVAAAQDMNRGIPSAVAAIESFRDIQSNLIGLSRVSDPALRRSVTALNSLIDQLMLGGSVTQRTIDLANEKINKYRGGRSATS